MRIGEIMEISLPYFITTVTTEELDRLIRSPAVRIEPLATPAPSGAGVLRDRECGLSVSRMRWLAHRRAAIQPGPGLVWQIVPATLRTIADSRQSLNIELQPV